MMEDSPPVQAPPWPEYMKEISRRSKAGFAEIHSELMQRYGAASTKDLNIRNTTLKQTTRQNRMSSIFFGSKTKSKERKNSLRQTQTFISYVEDDEDEPDQKKDAKVNVANPGAATMDKDSSLSDSKDSELHDSRKKEDSSKVKLKNVIMFDGNSEFKISKSPESQKQLMESVDTKEPIYQVPATDEPIYQVPRGTSIETNCLDINIISDTVFSEDDRSNSPPLYSNVCELPESVHYEIPKSPDGIKENTEHKSDKDFSIAMTTKEEPNDDRKELGDNKFEAFEADNDYIDMQGIVPTNLQTDKHLSYSAIEDKLRVTSDNTTQIRETLQIQSPASAPPSPSMYVRRAGSHDTVLNADNHTVVNEYVGPDPIEREKDKTPKSATVAPYIQETDPPRAMIQPATRPFVQYSVEEVVECFEACALPHVAKVCKEETLDGEYFRDLSDEDLEQEPFCLTRFHISKIRKIIAGWRPKRMTFSV